MLIQELAKQNRLAALLYKNKITLMKQRGMIDLYDEFYPGNMTVNSVPDLVDSFDWEKTPQGYDFWDKIWMGLKPY